MRSQPAARVDAIPEAHGVTSVLSVPRGRPVTNLLPVFDRIGRIEHMSDTCSCPYCGRPATGDDVDHTEAVPDAPLSRADNLTPVRRHGQAIATR